MSRISWQVDKYQSCQSSQEIYDFLKRLYKDDVEWNMRIAWAAFEQWCDMQMVAIDMNATAPTTLHIDKDVDVFAADYKALEARHWQKGWLTLAGADFPDFGGYWKTFAGGLVWAAFEKHIATRVLAALAADDPDFYWKYDEAADAFYYWWDDPNMANVGSDWWYSGGSDVWINGGWYTLYGIGFDDMLWEKAG